MKFYHNQNGIILDEKLNIVLMEESNPIFKQYVDFLKAYGVVEPIQYDTEIEKQIKIDELKKQQYDELFSTDWYFIRKIDTGIEIPVEIVEQRKAIREKYNTLIKNI